MSEISFRISREESDIIRRLAERARAIDVRVNPDIQRRNLMEWEMDFIACHANGCPLDLVKLEGFDEANFVHDAFGIARHLNRQSGHLGGCFCPRAAKANHV